jgi:hypothetical protein
MEQQMHMEHWLALTMMVILPDLIDHSALTYAFMHITAIVKYLEKMALMVGLPSEVVLMEFVAVE